LNSTSPSSMILGVSAKPDHSLLFASGGVHWLA
jgi:hypothetical protein